MKTHIIKDEESQDRLFEKITEWIFEINMAESDVHIHKIEFEGKYRDFSAIITYNFC